MIKNHDRSGWFGASDTATIMGNWNTKTFDQWWLEKLGLKKRQINTLQMQTGSAYEHRILDFCGIVKRDRQIRKRRYRLRVNLDGESDVIHEVKTHGAERFKVSKAYWQQCQVERYAGKKQVEIISYRLLPEDYQNWLRPIDPQRISRHPIDYDRAWVENEYLPRLKYLSKCLRRRKWPSMEEFNENRKRKAGGQ